MNDETKQIIDVVMDVAKMLSEKIDNVEQRLDKVEQRLDKIEQRLDKIEQRLDKLEQRFDKLEKRVDTIEAKIDVMADDITSIKLKNDVIETTLISHTYDISRLKKAQ